MSLTNQLSDEKETFATCLLSTDCTTTSGIEHTITVQSRYAIPSI